MSEFYSINQIFYDRIYDLSRTFFKKKDILRSSEMEMIVNTQIYRKVFSRIFEVKETSKTDKSIT